MGLTAPVVYLHIGAMKTGTTFLQGLLFANREQLRANGYLLPGSRWARQVRAVQDLLRDTQGDPRLEQRTAGEWEAIAQEILAHDGPSVVSMEFLSFARTSQARRAVTSLAGADVHVVLTVRDAVATLPSQWQSTVHNGSTLTWSDYMAGVRKAAGPARLWARYSPDRALRNFKRAHDVGAVLQTWGKVVPPRRLHVVTVPPPGSDRRLLWDRFASVLGVDPGVCTEPPAAANESLGYASTELLRRVNLELGPMPRTDYSSTVKEYLAWQVLSQRAATEGRARVDRPTCEFALGWNERTREAVEASGARVVGSLDELPTDRSDVPDRYVDEAQVVPTTEELLEAAVTAEEGLRHLVDRRLRRLRRRGAVGEHELARAMGPAGWADAQDPVRAATVDLAALVRTAVDLKRRLDR